MRTRLDKALVERGIVATRSQAESYIKLSLISVDGRVVEAASFMVSKENILKLNLAQHYVSRSGLKLASVANKLNLNFQDKIVLDVGSSTGGFTDYALKHRAKQVVAVDTGTEQLHPSLRTNERVELHEQTDIRNVNKLTNPADIVLIDVSFVSLRAILPKIHELSGSDTNIVAMFKPQFESGASAKNKGVIKNDAMRRKLLADFETWLKKNKFLIFNQADSEIEGAKGNKERFYLLKKEKHN